MVSEAYRKSKTVNGVTTTYYLDGSRIVGEETNGNITVYFYDSLGLPIGFGYHASTYGLDVFDVYWYEKNLQGDIVAVYNHAGTKLLTYTYDAWGACYTTNASSSVPSIVTNNPFRYRGYYYDNDLGLYYLNARYYDENTGRFISADGYVSTGQGLTGYNMYAYCGNNPVMYVDPTGEAWWHWALGAAIVVACAAAVVITAGGAAPGVAAVLAVANGVAATTTASTVAAGAFIGASVAYGSAAFIAASTSHSVDEFYDEGSWDTVIGTAMGGLMGVAQGFDIANSQLTKPTKQHIESGTSKAPQHGAVPNSRYIQYDQSTGGVRSDTVYNSNGDWYSRVDYLHTHNIGGINYAPHIHFSAPLNSKGQPIGREIVLPW